MAYINHHKIHENLWVCECGKEFITSKSLSVHARFCDKYVKIDKESKYKVDNEFICECGYKTINYQSFNAHLSHCDIHHNTIGRIKKLRPSELNHTMCWENKTDAEIKQIRLKCAESHSLHIKNGTVKSSFKGKHHSEKSKEKCRISTIKYLSQTISDFKPRYNKNACEFINKLNIDNGWNLLHAENGGEFCVLGYFLDGYDKELNIAFEYDESRHYKDLKNNILIDKDIIRQNNIINYLHCDFYRYNEKLNIFYKI